jgi:hypothetical protein
MFLSDTIIKQEGQIIEGSVVRMMMKVVVIGKF